MKVIFHTIFLLVSATAFSQSAGKDFSVGKTFLIQSEIMGDERTIQVFLPDGYEKNKIAYPVLYLLDGQRYFLHGVSLQQSFLDFKQTAPFIIVGIAKNRLDRNRNYSSNAKNYLSFIENGVINFVDKEFRTTKKRLLFGWAYGGGFVIQTLLSKPALFDGYIAASPFPIENKINDLDSLFAQSESFDKFLFFTSETSEGSVKEETQKLNTLLESKAPKLLNWTFKKLEAEEHRSTPFTTLYHGIREYYQYFPELQFNSLEEFNAAGGLPYVYNYYEQRAKQYNFQAKLSDWTMFSLTRNAMRANNYRQFDTFVKEFKETNFLKRLRINRAMSIANFHLQNNQYEAALKIYSLLVEQHPDSEKPLNGLGNTYSAMNDEKTALKFYKKAKEKN